MSRPVQTLIVVEEGATLPTDLLNQDVLRRTKRPIADQPNLLRSFEKWFQNVVERIQPRLTEEPLRLLGVRENRAAAISAITHLETVLRDALEKEEKLPGRVYSLGSLAELAARREVLTIKEHEQIRDWMRVRNMVVHSQDNVTRAKATEIVHGVMHIAQRVRWHT